MQHNSATSVQVKEVIQTKSVSGGVATNSLEVDTLGFQELLVIVSAGTFTSTGTLDVKVQDSTTTGSGFGDVTGAAFTQITDATDEKIYVGRIKLNSFTNGTTDKVERYIRVVATQATAATIYGVTVVLLNRSLPASYDAIVNATGGASTAATLAFNID
jgi:hypothetical protein